MQRGGPSSSLSFTEWLEQMRTPELSDRSSSSLSFTEWLELGWRYRRGFGTSSSLSFTEWLEPHFYMLLLSQ
jgi:hypothetical protein